MAINDLLNSLQKVKSTGRSKFGATWIACCPSHQDRRPSLTITEKPDGMVLMKCWAGCGAAEILSAIGMDYDALYPERTEAHSGKPIRRPWNPYDLLKIMAFEATVARICAADIVAGRALNEAETQRLKTAVRRLNNAAELANG